MYTFRRSVAAQTAEMETRRLYVPGCNTAQALLLTGEQARYARTVLRLKPGDTLTLFCGDGFDYPCKVQAVAKRGVELAPMDKRRVFTDPTHPLVLAQAHLKTAAMDEVVRAATALGITALAPFVAARSVGRPAASQQARWKRIAISAAQQCGRTTLPTIFADAASLEDLFALPPIKESDARYCCWEGAAKDDRAAPLVAPTQRARVVIVGPEGGLTGEEAAAARSHGCIFLDLGPRILRAELAAVVGLVKAAL